VAEQVPHAAVLSVGVLNAAEDEVEGAGLQQHREVFDAVIVGNEASFGPVHDMLPEDGV
jgi:hypothetical protein